MHISVATLIGVGLFTAAYASGQGCNAQNEQLWSNDKVYLNVCHSPSDQYDRKRLDEWQECTDATIYLTDEVHGRSEELLDCLPVETHQLRIQKDTLKIRYFYTTYPDFDSEPLMVETLDLKTNVKTYRFEKHFPECKKMDIGKAAKLIDETVAKPFDGKTFFNDIYSSFYRLRDCAQSDPKKVLSILKTYKEKGIFDGEVAETLSSVIDEVELIEKGESK